MNPAPPVTRRRIARRLATKVRETRCQTVAPMRKGRRTLALAAKNRIGRTRRWSIQLRCRDPPDTAIQPRLREDFLGEVGPGALALRRQVPDAARPGGVHERVDGAR